jgi:hypothetical protein
MQHLRSLTELSLAFNPDVRRLPHGIGGCRLLQRLDLSQSPSVSLMSAAADAAGAVTSTVRNTVLSGVKKAKRLTLADVAYGVTAGALGGALGAVRYTLTELPGQTASAVTSAAALPGAMATAMRSGGVAMLAPQLSLCQSLHTLQMDNVKLTSPPAHVCSLGATRVLAFLRNQLSASTPRDTVTVAIIGASGAGKSALWKCLGRFYSLKGSKMSSPSEQGARTQRQASTNGVEIHNARWNLEGVGAREDQVASATAPPSDAQSTLTTVGRAAADSVTVDAEVHGGHAAPPAGVVDEPASRSLQVEAWDYGGHEIFHITHQHLLPSQALYVLVWDTTEGARGLQKLRSALAELHCAVREPRVLVVGTHADAFGAQGSLAGDNPSTAATASPETQEAWDTLHDRVREEVAQAELEARLTELEHAMHDLCDAGLRASPELRVIDRSCVLRMLKWARELVTELVWQREASEEGGDATTQEPTPSAQGVERADEVESAAEADESVLRDVVWDACDALTAAVLRQRHPKDAAKLQRQVQSLAGPDIRGRGSTDEEDAARDHEARDFESGRSLATGARRRTLASTLSSAAWSMAPTSFKRRVYLRQQHARARDAAVSWNTSNTDEDKGAGEGWLVGVVWTSLTAGFGLTALQGKLEPLLQSEATNMRVPGHWAVLEQLVVEARTRFSTADAPPVMLWGDFCTEFGCAAGLSTEEGGVDDLQMCEAMTVLHSFGVVQFDPRLRSAIPPPPPTGVDDLTSLQLCSEHDAVVVLDPKWLADAFSSLITFQHSFVESRSGLIDATLQSMIWAAYPAHLHCWLTVLMEHFELVYHQAPAPEAAGAAEGVVGAPQPALLPTTPPCSDDEDSDDADADSGDDFFSADEDEGSEHDGEAAVQEAPEQTAVDEVDVVSAIEDVEGDSCSVHELSFTAEASPAGPERIDGSTRFYVPCLLPVQALDEGDAWAADWEHWWGDELPSGRPFTEIGADMHFCGQVQVCQVPACHCSLAYFSRTASCLAVPCTGGLLLTIARAHTQGARRGWADIFRMAHRGCAAGARALCYYAHDAG